LIHSHQIRWENRFRGDSYQRCLITVDGVDFLIPEPIQFSTEWFSHKFGSAGLRYELGIAINTGSIVWFNGPFPAGSFPDLRVFRIKLRSQLGPGEKVVADRGYRGDTKVCTPDHANSFEHGKAMNQARARHEATNHRLKTWKSLKQVFRHGRQKHHLVFRSAVVLTQIAMEHGRAPFQVTNYRDPAYHAGDVV
jgi:DDE superfamily endonuclease